jgi:hypothetical protein
MSPIDEGAVDSLSHSNQLALDGVFAFLDFYASEEAPDATAVPAEGAPERTRDEGSPE